MKTILPTRIEDSLCQLLVHEPEQALELIRATQGDAAYHHWFGVLVRGFRGDHWRPSWNALDPLPYQSFCRYAAVHIAVSQAAPYIEFETEQATFDGKGFRDELVAEVAGVYRAGMVGRKALKARLMREEKAMRLLMKRRGIPMARYGGYWSWATHWSDLTSDQQRWKVAYGALKQLRYCLAHTGYQALQATRYGGWFNPTHAWDTARQDSLIRAYRGHPVPTVASTVERAQQSLVLLWAGR